jgi:quercetin dioxygenase-like cupin family protein
MKFVREGSGEHWLEGRGYQKRILFSPAEVEGSQVQVVRIKRGFTVKPHYHTKSSEVLYVLKGRAKTTVSGEEFVARVGDSIYLQAGEVHAFDNSGGDEDFVLFVFKIHQPEEEDSFWAEDSR